MIGLIATLKIKEGKGADFEAVANQLVEKVRATEDGCVHYDLYKQNDTTYVFLERYKDEAALEIHRNTEHYKTIGAQMGAFMAGKPDIQILQSV